MAMMIGRSRWAGAGKYNKLHRALNGGKRRGLHSRTNVFLSARIPIPLTWTYGIAPLHAPKAQHAESTIREQERTGTPAQWKHRYVYIPRNVKRSLKIGINVLRSPINWLEVVDGFSGATGSGRLSWCAVRALASELDGM